MGSKIKKFVSTIPLKDIAIIILCGVLLSLAFVRYQLGWLILVTPMLLFWYIGSLEKRRLTNKQFILRVWAVGVVFFSITISWIYNIHATDLIADPWLRWLFLFLTLAIIVFVYSLGFLLFSFVIRRFKISLNQSRSFLIIPALWILCEYLRSFAFSIISFGVGATVGDLWNFGNFGFGASVTPLVYSGRLIGFYGISFLVVLLNLAIYHLIFGKLKKQAIIAVAVVIIMPSLGYALWANKNQGSTTKAGLTFLESDYTIGGDYRDFLLTELGKNNLKDTNLLILPEYSDIFTEETSKQKDAKIVKAFTSVNDNVKIITSVSMEDAKKRTNSVALYNEKAELLTYQDKQFLIPGGEFVPYLYQGILIASGNSSFVISHQQDKTLAKGTQKAKPIEIDGTNYGILACSGAIAPRYYQNLTKDGAEVLVNSASIASMGLDGFYFDQSKQMARFIAVANDRQFIQSSRGGQSFVINKNGGFDAQSKGPKTQYYNIVIEPNSSRTPYAQLGEWFLAITTLLLGIYLFKMAINK